MRPVVLSDSAVALGASTAASEPAFWIDCTAAPAAVGCPVSRRVDNPQRPVATGSSNQATGTGKNGDCEICSIADASVDDAAFTGFSGTAAKCANWGFDPCKGLGDPAQSQEHFEQVF